MSEQIKAKDAGAGTSQLSPAIAGLRIGIADNAAQWRSAFTGWISPLFSNFSLASVNYGMFADPVDKVLIYWAARLYAEGRDLESRASANDLDICAIGEIFAPYLSADNFSPGLLQVSSETDARKMFCDTVGNLLQHSPLESEAALASLITNRVNLGYTKQIEDGLKAEVRVALPFQVAYAILEHLALVSKHENPNVNAHLISHMFLAIIKRGSVSRDYKQKFSQALQEECSVRVVISDDLVRKLCMTYRGSMSSSLARATLEKWRCFVPKNALRLQFAITQAAWEGLLCLKTITRVFKQYADFPWYKLSFMYPYLTEISAYNIARRLVGEDEYYGFNNDLGVAVSSNYKKLATVCKKILVEISGDKGLRSFAGFTRHIPYEDKIDKLIHAYNVKKGNVEISQCQEVSHPLNLVAINEALKAANMKPVDSDDMYQVSTLDLDEE